MKSCKHHFKIICDETTNTPETIARNEMHGRIELQCNRYCEQCGDCLDCYAEDVCEGTGKPHSEVKK